MVCVCGGMGILRGVCDRRWLLRSQQGLQRRERGCIGGRTKVVAAYVKTMSVLVTTEVGMVRRS